MGVRIARVATEYDALECLSRPSAQRQPSSPRCRQSVPLTQASPLTWGLCWVTQGLWVAALDKDSSRKSFFGNLGFLFVMDFHWKLGLFTGNRTFL